jgi:hypothetical protein
MRRHNLLILVCLFATASMLSQPNNPYTDYLKAQAHFGFIMQHRNSVGHLVKGHIVGAELDWAFPTKGNKLWHYENNFPEAGVALHFYNLANNEQLGQIIALAPYYDIPLNEKEKRSRLYMRVSLGASYSDKKFDPIDNHKNNMVSTAINGFVNFKWHYRFNLSEKLRLDAGFNFAHISNGKFKAPNLGVNMFTANAGVTYKLMRYKTRPKFGVDSSSVAKSKNELYGIAAIGFNETEPAGGPKFLAQSYTLGYYRNVRNTHKFGGGLDVFYCQSVIQDVFDADSVRYDDKSKYIQIGARASYSYNVGKFSLPVEFGYYLRSVYRGDGNFYHRIGVRYYTNNNIILTFSLKTHWAVAHYFEYGVGYRLPMKRKHWVCKY